MPTAILESWICVTLEGSAIVVATDVLMGVMVDAAVSVIVGEGVFVPISLAVGATFID